eukprot:385833-Rhodomonas_salina.2
MSIKTRNTQRSRIPRAWHIAGLVNPKHRLGMFPAPSNSVHGSYLSVPSLSSCLIQKGLPPLALLRGENSSCQPKKRRDAEEVLSSSTTAAGQNVQARLLSNASPETYPKANEVATCDD